MRSSASPRFILAVVLGPGAALALGCGSQEQLSLGSTAVDASTAEAMAFAGDATSEGPGDAVEESIADAGSEAVATADAPSAAGDAGPACPAAMPEAGTACNGAAACGAVELVCEYGSDPRIGNGVSCVGGIWFGGTGHLLGDASSPSPEAGCPPSYDSALAASACDVPSCSYPEGTCTCWVSPQPVGDASTGWSCTQPALPAGCPPTLVAAQAGATCLPGARECYYAGGTCTCSPTDAGNPWRCTVPEAGCPATRPRLGSPCDPSLRQQCNYIPVGCTFPTGNLYCSCGGVWVSKPGALCQ